MVKWQLVYTRQALKDAKRLAAAGLKERALGLLQIPELNPYQTPPPYEELAGDLTGAYSRRINIQHRLVYEVLEKERVVKVIRLWSHYDWEGLTRRFKGPATRLGNLSVGGPAVAGR